MLTGIDYAGAITVFDGAATAASLPFNALIPALLEMFAAGTNVPLRRHHAIRRADIEDATLLLMSACQDGGVLGVKLNA